MEKMHGVLELFSMRKKIQDAIEQVKWTVRGFYFQIPGGNQTGAGRRRKGMNIACGMLGPRGPYAPRKLTADVHCLSKRFGTLQYIRHSTGEKQ